MKQIKDTLKNLPVLVLFIVYPCIALIMTNAINQEGTDTLFVGIFATMHCVFTPIVAMASVLSEEKETNTLRVLIYSNVRLSEYFLSVGGFILLADLLTGCFFLAAIPLTPQHGIQLLLSMVIGCLISLVFGICIGLYAKNASSANALAVPFGMIFSFLPMLASFNTSIKKFSSFTYGQQVNYLITGESIQLNGILIILANAALFLILSAYLYRKSVSEE